MGSVNSQFILSLIIIALGYASKRFHIITEKDGEGLAKVVFNFTLPALVINTFSTIKVDLSLALLPLMSLIYGTLMALLALFMFRREERSDRGMLSMLLPGFNIGLFAYPLVEAVWGQNGLKYLGMFDMGNSIVTFVFSYLLGSCFSLSGSSVNMKEIVKKTFKCIPLLAYMGTLSINIAGLHFPAFVLDISKVISRANAPLSLLLLGIYLSFSFESSDWGRMLKLIATRYGIGIATGVLLFLVLPLEPMFRNVLLVGFMMPIALSVIPYSVQFDYSRKFVGTVTNFTNVISFILIWAAFNLISTF